MLNAQCARTMCVCMILHFFRSLPFLSISLSPNVMMYILENLSITFQSHFFLSHILVAKYAKSAEREKSHIIKITNGNKYRTVFRPVGRYRYQFWLEFHIWHTIYALSMGERRLLLYFISFFAFSLFFSSSFGTAHVCICVVHT